MRVVIVEDQPLFLDAIATSLQSRDVDVVGRAREVEEAMRVIDEAAADVALLDIRLPPAFTDEGLQVAEMVRRRYPEVAILVLSSYAELAFAERLLVMEAEPHAVGYLLKERVGDVGDLIDALTRVVAGEVVVDSHIVARLMARRRRHDPLEVLTAHERRVLGLVAEGRSNLGIAQQLGCRISTVEKHLVSITAKLGLRDAPGSDRRGVNLRVLATLEFLRSS
ncbi:response regulator transcription factor [Nonomuraea typhae]|uniref:response regulator transcription factor n=1 Tax=Nonomuraea typhae TaxID=2603600 RepID=UPI0012FC8DE6|nr:response regulator transcription factor [Nonomuraea typhae]